MGDVVLEVMGTQQKARGPVRTCVGCRQRQAGEVLVRFAIHDEAPFIAPDLAHKLPGRGVHVHPTRACVARALQKGGFARALRRPVPLDVDGLCALIGSQYRRRIDGLLLAARRGRNLAFGTDAVREAIGAGDARLLVVAGDAAGRREELARVAERLGRACVVLGTKQSLGHLLGRGEVGVLAVLDAGIAEQVADAAACVAALSEGE